MGYLIIQSTCPDDVAKLIAAALVEEKLAACVNMVGSVRSTYQWRGQTESTTETLLIIKATGDHYDQIEQRLRALHPYELPEIVATPIIRGYEPYLQWIQDSTHP